MKRSSVKISTSPTAHTRSRSVMLVSFNGVSILTAHASASVCATRPRTVILSTATDGRLVSTQNHESSPR